MRLRWLIGQSVAQGRLLQRAPIVVMVLLGLMVVSQVPGVAPVLAADPLFTPANAPADAGVAAAVSGDRSVKRSRQVGVDFQQLTGPKKSGPDRRRAGAQGSRTLALNLFADVSLTAEIRSVTRTSSGAGQVLTGTVQGGGPFSSVTIVAENGIMTANIRPSPDHLFQVRYAGGRTHAIYEIDPPAFPTEDSHDVGLQLPPGSLGSAPTQATRLQTEDTDTIIDVLVVYTPAARAQVGGAGAMNSLIDLALAETNQGYANSDVIQRVSIVHRTEVTYAEQPPNTDGTSGFNTDLNRLASTTDGILDNVHTLRNTYGADFVSLVRTADTATVVPLCGIAAMIFGEGGPGNLTVAYGAPRAFNVVAQNCMTGNYTFAHELGHTMGVRHNIEADPTQNQPYTYNHGYCALTGTPPFRDIMAVNLSCNNQNLPRLNHWSNPSIVVNGVPSGNVTADGQLTLDNTLPLTQNFRQKVETGPANDSFASPTTITGALPQARSQSTTGATGEPGETASCAFPDTSVWFTWTPTTSGSATIHTAGSSYDTILAVFAGSALGSLTEVGCNDDFDDTLQSQLSVNVTAGTTYRIMVDGYDGATGDLTLTIASLASPADPRQEGPVSVTGTLTMGNIVSLTVAVKNYGGSPTPAIHPYVEGTNTVGQSWRADDALPPSAVIQPGQTVTFALQHTLSTGGLWTTTGIFLWNDDTDAAWKPLPANGQSQQVSFEVGINCSPRPAFHLTTARSGDGRLAVTLTATATEIGNRVSHIQFTPDARVSSPNAVVDLPGVGAGLSPESGKITVPNRPTEYTFYIRRVAPGPVTLPFNAYDLCGARPGFAGGGASFGF